MIGFIGAGHMAEHLIRGFLAAGMDSDQIVISNRNEDKRLALESELSVIGCTSNIDVVKRADIIILAIKPLMHAAVVAEIKEELLLNSKVLITVAIAVSSAMLRSWLGHDYPLVRAMPNLPVKVKQGVTGLYKNPLVSDQQYNSINHLFSKLGLVLWFDQEQSINAFASISGNGPAYCFMMMEAWILAAIDQGLNCSDAKDVVGQVIKGALDLALTSEYDVSELRTQVTSPGGSTEAAIEVFGQHDMVAIFKEAMEASSARIAELQKQMEDDLCLNSQ